MGLPPFWIGLLGLLGAFAVLAVLYGEHRNRRRNTPGTRKYLRIVSENWDRFSKQTSFGLVLIVFAMIVEINQSALYWGALLLFFSQISQGGSWTGTLYARISTGIGMTLYVLSIATISIALLAELRFY